MEVWDKERGGVFPMGQAVKPLAALRKKGHTEHEIARRLEYYLRHKECANEMQYESIPKFAQTFKMWDGSALAFPEDE